MWQVQTRTPNAAGTRLGPWKDMRFGGRHATEQEAAEAAAMLDPDGIVDPQFVRVVPVTAR